MKRAGVLFVPLLILPLFGSIFAPVFAAASPILGASATYGVLSSSYINTVPGTFINGDVGFTTSPSVTPGGTHTNYGSSAPYTAAGADQASASSALASQPCTHTFPAASQVDLSTDISHGTLGVYTPGIYCNATSGSFTKIGAAGITLSGAGTYIFRMANILNTDNSSKVLLANGASPCDIWWTPTPGPVLPTFGMDSTFVGTYLDSAGLKLPNNVTWSGRILAYGGSVETSIDDNITVPTCPSKPTNHLNIIKTVVNAHYGTSVASDFSLHVKLAGVDVSGSPAAGAVAPGTDYLIADGTYVVSEDAQSGYTATFSGDCDANGNVTVGPTDKTCTITNTDDLTSKICVTSGSAGSPGGVKTTCTISATSPSATPTPSPSGSPTPSPSGSPTPSPSGSATPSPSGSPTPSPSGSPTPLPSGYPTSKTTPGKPIPGVGDGFIPIFPHTGLNLLIRSSSSKTVGNPKLLSIPRLGTKAIVESVGLTPSKQVDVPKGPGHVAWYKLGARPGNIGTAVIDGHFARKTSGWAVFNDLYKLRPGDALSVQDSKGKILHFVVRSSQVYELNARPREVYYSDSGAHLNLVTCAGVWINSINGFNKRLVVFTDFVD